MCISVLPAEYSSLTRETWVIFQKINPPWRGLGALRLTFLESTLFKNPLITKTISEKSASKRTELEFSSLAQAEHSASAHTLTYPHSTTHASNLPLPSSHQSRNSQALVHKCLFKTLCSKPSHRGVYILPWSSPLSKYSSTSMVHPPLEILLHCPFHFPSSFSRNSELLLRRPSSATQTDRFAFAYSMKGKISPIATEMRRPCSPPNFKLHSSASSLSYLSWHLIPNPA